MRERVNASDPTGRVGRTKRKRKKGTVRKRTERRERETERVSVCVRESDWSCVWERETTGDSKTQEQEESKVHTLHSSRET